MKTNSLRKKMIRHTFALMTTMACAPHVGGDTLLTGPFTPAPGTAEAVSLMANKSAIMHLADQAETGGSTSARRAALQTLANTYTEVSLNLATELIKDPDTAVAADSARLLAYTLAMAGSVTMGRQMHSPGTPARRQFDAAVTSLRDAVDDVRIEVRDVAAGTLAYLEDRTALDTIELGVKKGVIPAVEAVGYFGLASSEFGGPYIEKYLSTGPVEARVAAAGYLATIPTYQPRIRDLILGAKQVDETVLAKAAGVLSRHDRTFPTYALEVASRLDVPEVSDLVAHAYVSDALRIKALDPNDWQHRMQEVENALMRHPDRQSLRMIKAGLMNEGHMAVSR